MAINAYFFDSTDTDPRKYSAMDFAKAFGIILKDGVIIGSEPTIDISAMTISPMKATVQGHFIEITDLEYFYVSGTFEGQVVLRLDPISARNVYVAVREDRTPTQIDEGLFEYPLYNISVTEGVINSASAVYNFGGASVEMPSDLVTYDEMNTAIQNALASYVTQGSLTNTLKNYSTPSSVDSQINSKTANMVKWTNDPNGVYLTANNHEVFLTTAQPSNKAKRVWIQTS